MIKTFYFYTNDCSICGKGTISKLGPLRQKVSEFDYELYVKEVPLFQGWKSEAKELGEELPFFYNPNTNLLAKLDDLLDGEEVKLDMLHSFLGIPPQKQE